MNLPTVLEALNTIQDNPKATAITLISITAATGLYLYRKSTRAKQSQVETKDSTPILVGGLLQKTPFPHGGPFVAKLEACLRYANFTFKVGIPPTGFSARPPNRKVPGLWYKGELLGDSELIVKRLVKDGEIEDVNSWMDPVSRANAEMLRLSVENFIYWRVGKERWLDHADETIEVYFGGMQNRYAFYFLSVIQKRLALPSLRKMFDIIGTTRYPEEAWVDMEHDFWLNVSVILGEKKYLFSEERMCMADFTVFGSLVNIVEFRHISPKEYEAVSKHQNLLEYVARIKQQLYPTLSN